MRRRKVLAAVGGAFSSIGVGCLSRDSLGPDTEIAAIELENQRRDGGYEFTVRIERGDETVFEESRQLDQAGSGNSTAVFEQPVEVASTHEVHVQAGEYAANVTTENLISGEETCISLRFYLVASTLHWDHTSYERCE
ncbi:MAG: hypothetical protein V5A27_07075 [Halapricum sp.]